MTKIVLMTETSRAPLSGRAIFLLGVPGAWPPGSTRRLLRSLIHGDLISIQWDLLNIGIAVMDDWGHAPRIVFIRPSVDLRRRAGMVRP